MGSELFETQLMFVHDYVEKNNPRVKRDNRVND